MRKTTVSDLELSTRLAVSDQELAILLGCGLATARRIASDASAVVKCYGRKQNVVSKIQKYLEEIAEE